ncbi:hypothetical protein HK097_009062 [Rhizophlyctis rosea]|uniref:Uncharacterized protein n=1 Tax=Rhizophlyctis rosea TaxID=64517 RepID=A0AAD5SB38_9FUNG|nr:hypothetical protein HK097_009062 [Rhizophlyctis rosea]
MANQNVTIEVPVLRGCMEKYPQSKFMVPAKVLSKVFDPHMEDDEEIEVDTLDVDLGRVTKRKRGSHPVGHNGRRLGGGQVIVEFSLKRKIDMKGTRGWSRSCQTSRFYGPYMILHWRKQTALQALDFFGLRKKLSDEI